MQGMRHYERLAAALAEHRRGTPWGEFATRIGLSESALRNIRTGRNEPNELTKARIEDALNWAPGSVDAVLAGQDPTPVEASARTSKAAPSTLDELRAENAELRAAVGSLTSENASLAIQVEEVEVLHRELLELRAEVERLRRDRSTA